MCTGCGNRVCLMTVASVLWQTVSTWVVGSPGSSAALGRRQPWVVGSPGSSAALGRRQLMGRRQPWVVGSPGSYRSAALGRRHAVDRTGRQQLRKQLFLGQSARAQSWLRCLSRLRLSVAAYVLWQSQIPFPALFGFLSQAPSQHWLLACVTAASPSLGGCEQPRVFTRRSAVNNAYLRVVSVLGQQRATIVCAICVCCCATSKAFAHAVASPVSSLQLAVTDS